MRIYIAAKLSDRMRLRAIREELFKLGHECVSTWLDEVAKPEAMDMRTFLRKLAVKDLTEIRAADLLILDTLSPLSAGGGGGREFEVGFAIGQWHHKDVWRVGPGNNAFHELVDRAFATWDDCLSALRTGDRA